MECLQIKCYGCGREIGEYNCKGIKALKEISDRLIKTGWNSFYSKIYCPKCADDWRKYMKVSLWGAQNTRRLIYRKSVCNKAYSEEKTDAL